MTRLKIKTKHFWILFLILLFSGCTTNSKDIESNIVATDEQETILLQEVPGGYQISGQDAQKLLKQIETMKKRIDWLEQKQKEKEN